MRSIGKDNVHPLSCRHADGLVFGCKSVNFSPLAPECRSDSHCSDSGSAKDRDSGPLPERPCRTVLRHTGGKQLRLFGVENHTLEHHMRLPEKVGTAAVPVTQKPGPYLVFLLRRRLAGKIAYQQI